MDREEWSGLLMINLLLSRSSSGFCGGEAGFLATRSIAGICAVDSDWPARPQGKIFATTSFTLETSVRMRDGTPPCFFHPRKRSLLDDSGPGLVSHILGINSNASAPKMST